MEQEIKSACNRCLAKAGLVLKRSFVFRIGFSAGRQFSAWKYDSSPCAKPLIIVAISVKL